MHSVFHRTAKMVIVLLTLANGTVAPVGDGEDTASCTASTDGTCAAAESKDAESGSGSSCGCGALKRSDFDVTGGKVSGKEASDDEAKVLGDGGGETETEAAIIYVDGGSFVMGVVPDDEHLVFIYSDGEKPTKQEHVGPFGLGKFEVSNARFSKFVGETNYRTEAEDFGWSFGVEPFITPETNAGITQMVQAAPWWLPVNGADWMHPNGNDTSIDAVMNHPVTQVSLRDAEAFCRWSRPGGRLPTEAEWEFAAKGGKSTRRYPWGQRMLTGKNASKLRHRMNIWQSELDAKLIDKAGDTINLNMYGEESTSMVKEYYSSTNLALDGYKSTAPVDSYGPQNTLGFYNLVGNVWEWTSSHWKQTNPRAPPVEKNTMVKKGGSFLCNPATCNRFRNSARMLFTADSAAYNVGFRCAYPGKPSV